MPAAVALAQAHFALAGAIEARAQAQQHGSVAAQLEAGEREARARFLVVALGGSPAARPEPYPARLALHAARVEAYGAEVAAEIEAAEKAAWSGR